MPTQQDSLHDWLCYLGSIHSSAIDMGLERVRPVFSALNLSKPRFVFMVAGTNGKGSVSATLAALCQETGLKTALYQSPHLVSFTERIRLDGTPIDEAALINAFCVVEAARVNLNVSLSFFEMTTLAAFWLFDQADCDVWVLEVGLGGRLDVVNLIDANVCVISNVAIDHTDWLGNDRESIGYEKVGIVRPYSTVIYGEADMPNSVLDTLKRLGVPYYQAYKDYHFDIYTDCWIYSNHALTLGLPHPNLAHSNVATALSAYLASPFAKEQRSLDIDAINRAIKGVRLAGRFDCRVYLDRQFVFDVAHNKAGVDFLLSLWQPFWHAYRTQNPKAKLFVLFSMLADKEVEQVLSQMNVLEAHAWHIAPLDTPRSLSKQSLQHKTQAHIQVPIACHDSISDGLQALMEQTQPMDVVLCFGSFHTIAEAFAALSIGTETASNLP